MNTQAVAPPEHDVDRFAIGPLHFRAREWPIAWSRYWAPYVTPGSATALTIDVVASDPSGQLEVFLPAGADAVHGIRASGSDGSRWTIGIDRVFAAAYDIADRRLTIHSNDDTAPHMALGTSLRVLTSALLPVEHEGLMMFASSRIIGDNGIAFAGMSSAEKSSFGEGALDSSAVTTEITLLGSVSSTPTLLAAPFHGALGGRGEVGSVPLRALCIRGDKLGPMGVERMQGSAAAAGVVQHAARFFPERPLAVRLLDLIMKLVRTVPVFQVHRSLADQGDDVLRAALHSVLGGERGAP